MSLVVVEMRRGLARRSTRGLITVAVVLSAVVAVGVFVNSRAEVDAETAQLEGAAGREAYVRDCMGSGGFGGEVPGRSPAELHSACEASAGPLGDFRNDKQFELTELWPGHGRDGALGGTALFLMIGALMAGASFIGGDWRHGTVATLLTWEPRRLRVFLAKAAAAGIVALVVGFLLQSFFSAALLPSAIWRGTTEGADAEWLREFVLALIRISALGAAAALIGYAIAMIGRNTAAALGVGFGYFAVLEPILRAWKPEWQPWLIGDNATVVLFGEQLDSAPFERTLIEASLILCVYLAAVLGVAALSFTRRDVSV